LAAAVPTAAAGIQERANETYNGKLEEIFE